MEPSLKNGTRRFRIADHFFLLHSPWDKQLLHIGPQRLSRPKWPPEANIAIGTNQKESSLLGLIALMQFTCHVLEDSVGLWLRSSNSLLCDQVRLDHLLIALGQQRLDLTPSSLDGGRFLLAC